MSFSYDFNNIETNPLDDLRFRLGDTTEVGAFAPLFQDEELTALLNFNNQDVTLAELAALEILANRFALLSDQVTGKVQTKYSQISEAYQRRADAIRADVLTLEAVPYAGGISRADEETEVLDPDRVEPLFRVRQFDVVELEPFGE